MRREVRSRCSTNVLVTLAAVTTDTHAHNCSQQYYNSHKMHTLSIHCQFNVLGCELHCEFDYILQQCYDKSTTVATNYCRLYCSIMR